MGYSPPGSSIHGILQARIVEWVAISFSRGSSRLRDRILISCTGRQILHWRATWKALTTKPGMLQSMGLQRVRHDRTTEQQQHCVDLASASLCILIISQHTLTLCTPDTLPFCFHFMFYALPTAVVCKPGTHSSQRSVSPTPAPPSDFYFTTTSLGKPSFTPECSQSLGCYL